MKNYAEFYNKLTKTFQDKPANTAAYKLSTVY